MKADWETINNLFSLKLGKYINKDDLKSDGQFPYLNGGINPSGFSDYYNETKEQVAISTGGSAGFVNWLNTNFWAGGDCLLLIAKADNIKQKFFYYFLKWRQKELLKLQKGGCIPHLDKNSFKMWKMPLLPLKKQQEIIKKIDVLNTLTFDNLPKEIELRKKQYQHYLNAIFKKINCL